MKRIWELRKKFKKLVKSEFSDKLTDNIHLPEWLLNHMFKDEIIDIRAGGTTFEMQRPYQVLVKTVTGKSYLVDAKIKKIYRN